MWVIYDYKCTNTDCNAKFEAMAPLNNPDNKARPCPSCGTTANRVITAPNFHLNGTTGDFPTATQKWEEDHIRRAKETTDD